MCEPVSIGIALASAAMMAYGQYQQAKTQEQAMKFEAETADQNAKIKQKQAIDAENIGAENASTARERWIRANATLRATGASAGLNPDTGTMGDLQDQNTITGETDFQTVLNNTQREAWGIRVEGVNYQNEAKLKRWQASETMKNGKWQAATTLVKGLGTAASGIGKMNTGAKAFSGTGQASSGVDYQGQSWNSVR